MALLNPNPQYFTDICVEQKEYDANNNLATSTNACYRPLDVYGSISIEFFFVAVVVAFVFMLVRKKKK